MTGIGITTVNREKHLDLVIDQIRRHTPTNTRIFIYHDTHKNGVAHAKNECLKELSDCDHIFLFDDDCFPILTGWDQFFIDHHQRTGQHHFMYLKDTPSIIKTGVHDDIGLYHNCAGCFMFLTKEVIEKVGGYNPNYKGYGYEHAGYSNRIFWSGLNTFGAYLCPEKAGEFIYSLDLDNHIQFPKLTHYPTLSTVEIFENIEHNKAVYSQEEKQIYQNI
jgi:glycosyltransferase involved in cell wall biosynthesis